MLRLPQEVGKMSANDLVFLDSNFKNWNESRGSELKKGIDPFVYYSVEQFLKPYDASDEDIASGVTDGANDGGVDAIYFILNRSTFVRDDTAFDHKGVLRAKIVIFTIKSGNEGFRQNEVDKLYFFTDDLLDLSKPTSEMTARYHQHLIQVMDTIKRAYLRIAGSFPSVSIDYYYITRADEITPDKKQRDCSGRVVDKARSHLSSAECQFHFVNAQELLNQVAKRPQRNRTIIWSEQPMQAKEGFVGLVKLPDYFSFISDKGELAEHIFEANVRGFQQDTPVNTQIRQSLEASDPPNFWLLNNGITIVAESAPSAGHLRHELQDPQVVNGLQTSREIFNYFEKKKPGSELETRSILVRVIPTLDDVVRDTIIKATNSQNKMEPASLRATDPIHHQIEDLFKRYNLYYDRRKGYYKDKSRPARRIISVMEVVKATVCIVLQRPDDSRARSGDYIKDDRLYESIFGKNVLPLDIYLKCVQMVRRAESFLDSRDELGKGDELNIRFYVAAEAACRACGDAKPSVDMLSALDPDTISDQLWLASFVHTWRLYTRMGKTDTVAKGSELNKKLRASARRRFRRPTKRGQ